MSSRVRKQSDCPVGKQGPMRAILPVSSVMKQSGGGGFRNQKSSASSPTLSPTNLWRRASPDQSLSGQRSPGAINYRGRGRYGPSTIRRTASLDTLTQRGQWPRDYYLNNHLQVDKFTQTDDGGGASGRSSRNSDDERLERLVRGRLPRARAEPAQTISPGFWARYSGSSSMRAARSSVEGLNQEIERLVLSPGAPGPACDRLRGATPDGHRAPLAEMLRRSVNTQTPHDLSATQSSGGSVCSSPDLDGARLGTSPQINRFLAREPPDGCERVYLRPGDGVSSDPPTVMKPTTSGFTLRPSLGSAFQPLAPQPVRPRPVRPAPRDPQPVDAGVTDRADSRTP